MHAAESAPPARQKRPSLLPEELVRALVAVGQVDVLVGIPTLDNAATVGRVVQTVIATFATALVRQRTLLLDADGGSSDGTQDIVRGLRSDGTDLVLTHHPLRTVHRVATPYHGVPGRHSALRLVFAAADLLGAKAVVIVDPDAVALSTADVAALARAVLEDGLDVIKPVTRRSPWERPLLTQLIAPLLRAVYGKRVLEPIATQFACSGRFASRVLREFSAWDAPDASDRIDAWLAARAMTSPARIGQAWAPGAAEPPHGKRPSLREVFQQVVGALISVLCEDVASWRALRGSEDIPTLGSVQASGSERPAFDVSSYGSAFTCAVRDLAPVLSPALGAATFAELAVAATRVPLRLEPQLWARIVLRTLASALQRQLPVSQLAAALFPVYLGRVASFFEETRDLGPDEANAANDALGLCFEHAKAEIVDNAITETR